MLPNTTFNKNIIPNVTKFFSGYVYLWFISVTDFGSLFCLLIWNTLELVSPVNPHNQDISCKTLVLVCVSLMNSTSHLLAAMGIERAYALYQPINYRENVQVSTNIKVSSLCILVATAINFPSVPLFGTDVGYCFGVQKSANILLLEIHTLVVILINYFLPLLFIIITNALLIVKLKKRGNSRLYNSFEQ